MIGYIDIAHDDEGEAYPVWVDGEFISSREGRWASYRQLSKAVALAAEAMGVDVEDVQVTPQFHSHVAAETDEPDSFLVRPRTEQSRPR